ncbi:hypothetical protein, partial [Tolypothrix sp. VBCCA 56010]|uniref:hypothetical protein n=1 Tax=Tolypothrix sp. VBCCA 56010 TaxID=3137731 RepID=UPI003D7CF622
YVIARTKIEPVLERFLEAQSQYLEVLAEFKAAIAANPGAVEFEATALGSPRIVEAETSIRLAGSPVNVKLR